MQSINELLIQQKTNKSHKRQTFYQYGINLYNCHVQKTKSLQTQQQFDFKKPLKNKQNSQINSEMKIEKIVRNVNEQNKNNNKRYQNDNLGRHRNKKWLQDQFDKQKQKLRVFEIPNILKKSQLKTKNMDDQDDFHKNYNYNVQKQCYKSEYSKTNGFNKNYSYRKQMNINSSKLITSAQDEIHRKNNNQRSLLNINPQQNQSSKLKQSKKGELNYAKQITNCENDCQKKKFTPKSIQQKIRQSAANVLNQQKERYKKQIKKQIKNQILSIQIKSNKIKNRSKTLQNQGNQRLQNRSKTLVVETTEGSDIKVKTNKKCSILNYLKKQQLKHHICTNEKANIKSKKWSNKQQFENVPSQKQEDLGLEKQMKCERQQSLNQQKDKVNGKGSNHPKKQNEKKQKYESIYNSDHDQNSLNQNQILKMYQTQKNSLKTQVQPQLKEQLKKFKLSSLPKYDTSNSKSKLLDHSNVKILLKSNSGNKIFYNKNKTQNNNQNWNINNRSQINHESKPISQQKLNSSRLIKRQHYINHKNKNSKKSYKNQTIKFINLTSYENDTNNSSPNHQNQNIKKHSNFSWKGQRIHHQSDKKFQLAKSDVNNNIQKHRLLFNQNEKKIKINRNIHLIVTENNKSKINVFHNSTFLRQNQQKMQILTSLIQKCNQMTQKIQIPKQLGINKVNMKLKRNGYEAKNPAFINSLDNKGNEIIQMMRIYKQANKMKRKQGVPRLSLKGKSSKKAEQVKPWQIVNEQSQRYQSFGLQLGQDQLQLQELDEYNGNENRFRIISSRTLA